MTECKKGQKEDKGRSQYTIKKTVEDESDSCTEAI